MILQCKGEFEASQFSCILEPVSIVSIVFLMDKSKSSRLDRNRIPTSEEPQEKTERSEDDSESSYTENSSITEAKNTGKNKTKTTRISKQELKRWRNREAAKKSRKLKKDYIQKLETENILLKKENSVLLNQLVDLKEKKLCVKCSVMIPEDSLDRPDRTELDPPEIEVPILYPQLATDANRRQDDDMRYERIIEDDNKNNGLQKYFLALILIVLVLWLKAPDIKQTIRPLFWAQHQTHIDTGLSKNQDGFNENDEQQSVEITQF